MSDKKEPFFDDTILFSTISQHPLASNLKADIDRLLETESHQCSLMNDTGTKFLQYQSQFASLKLSFFVLTISLLSTIVIVKANLEVQTNKVQAIYLITSLGQFGFQILGKLDGKEQDQMQTLNTVYTLLQQRQKDIEFRSQMIEFKAKMESDLDIHKSKNVRLRQENDRLNKQLGEYENKQVQMNQQKKEEKNKLQSEISELQKSAKLLNQKLVQSQHEAKKKEMERDKAREQIGEIEYCSQLAQNAEEMNQKLLEENQQLRNGIAIIQNELNALVSDIQQEFIAQRVKETNQKPTYLRDLYFGDSQLNNINEGLFALPFEKVGVQIISLYNDNFQIVKEIIGKIAQYYLLQNESSHNNSDIQAIKDNLANFQTQIEKNQKLQQNMKAENNKKDANNNQNNNIHVRKQLNFTKNQDSSPQQNEQQFQQKQYTNEFHMVQEESEPDKSVSHQQEYNQNKENVSFRISKDGSNHGNLQDILEEVHFLDNEENYDTQNTIKNKNKNNNLKTKNKQNQQSAKKQTVPIHNRMKTTVSPIQQPNFLQQYKKDQLDTKSELSLSFVSQVSIKDVSELQFDDKDTAFNYTPNNDQFNKNKDFKPITEELKKWHMAFNQSPIETSSNIQESRFNYNQEDYQEEINNNNNQNNRNY